MTWQAVLHSAALLAAAALTVPLAFHGWRRRSSPGGLAFALMMVSGSAWALIYLIETTTSDLGLKQQLLTLRFLPMVALPFLWAAYCLLYVGPPPVLRQGGLALAAGQSVATWVFVATNDLHGLMWQSLRLVEQPWGSVFIMARGPAFWEFYAATYLALAGATGLLILRVLRSPGVSHWQAMTVLLAVAIPAGGNLYSVIFAPTDSGLDLSPVLFPVSALAFALSLFQFKLLDLVPLPRDRRIEHLRDGVVMLDSRFRVAELNPAAEDLIGAAIPVGAALEVASPAWRSVVEPLRIAGEVETEVILPSANRQQVLDIRGVTTRNVVGTVTGAIIVLRDVTERREAERAIADLNSRLERRVFERTAELETANRQLEAELDRRRQVEEELRRLSTSLEQRVIERSAALAAANAATSRSESRFNDLVQNAKDIVFSSSLSGKLLAVNGAVEPLLGYRPEEVIGTNMLTRLSPEDAERSTEMTARKLAGERVTVYEANLRARDGRLIPFEFSSWLRYRNGEPVEVQGIARDVSERHALQAQLLQAQRLEAVGRLAGGIAHDFNNLLTAINGFSQLLIDAANPTSQQAEFAREIKKAGDQAAILTARLLAYGRRTMLQPEIIDLNEIVSDLGPMLQRLLGEDLPLQIELGSVLRSIKADRTQIQQVIVNLAVNARDAMPNGGRIEIRTENCRIDDETGRRLDGLPPGPYVVLTVRDYGVGMHDSILDHIFEPFFTTKEVGQGSGLGLATVYGIIKQSGGHVTAESTLGAGSTFRVYLPAEAGPPADSPASESVKPVVDRPATILFVEDEAVVRSLVREIFRVAGIEVLVADGSTEALDLANRIEGTLDLLITDVIMPEMNGRELAQRLSDRWPDLPVLYISGYAEDVIMHRGVLDPGCEVLAKPFSPRDLVAAVQRLLSRTPAIPAEPVRP